jgi:YbbR domain-containing protein
VLDGVNKIVLGNIDLSDADNNQVYSYQIIIPNGAKNVSGEAEATVTIKVKNKETAVIRATNITFINVPDGFEAANMTQLVQTKVRASTSDIRQITSSSLRVVADMADYTQAGTYTVPVTIYIDGYPDAGVIGDYTIVASLAKSAE